MPIRFLIERLGIRAPKAERIFARLRADPSSPFQYERNLKEAEAWYQLNNLIDSPTKSKREMATELLAAAQAINDASRVGDNLRSRRSHTITARQGP